MFLKNIIRLNLKKIMQSPFQSLLFVLLNFFLFVASSLQFEEAVRLSQLQFYFVFMTISIANLLYIYNNIIQKIPAISLLRSMGASRVYVIFDFSIEFLLLYIISALIFVFTLFFYHPFSPYLIFCAYEIGYLLFISVLITVLAIKYAEKREKGE